MKRNCNLGIRLPPPPPPPPPPPASLQLPANSLINSMTLGSIQNPQEATVFNGGDGINNVCVDMTELQVRAIILLARRESEERLNCPYSEPTSPSTTLQFQLHSPPGITVKRSLQRFLQRRKNRLMQASSPYNNQT